MKPKVIIYSDYICPFCYIGKDRVEKLQKEFDLEFEWRGFEIHPETPKDGATLDDLNFEPKYIEMIKDNIDRLADDANMRLNFSDMISNSRLAMDISEYARAENKFEEFNNAVFDAYWLKGIDIGNEKELLKIAKDLGLDEKKIQEFLDSEKPKEIFAKYLLESRKYNVSGVPPFIIGNKVVVGAQPYEVLQKVVQEVLSSNGS